MRLIRRLAVIVAAAGLLSGMGTAAALADQVPPDQFTCLVTNFTTPCNQTAHFTTISLAVTPPPVTATGCPDYINTENADLEGTGSGIEHAVLNDNHGTFTTTFTGEATLTFRGGTVLTGHFTFSSGGSFNYQNSVVHETINFRGTDQNGNPISFHAVYHQGFDAAGVPHDVIIATCS
jgi:hypothetical protein